MASGKKSRAGYGDVELKVNGRSVKDSRGSGVLGKVGTVALGIM